MTAVSPLGATDQLFFERAGARLDRAGAERLLAGVLEGTDDGELFLEYRESEMISLDDGVIRSASFDTSTGFGLRAVLGDEAAYAHSDEISESALRRAASTVGMVRAGRSGVAADRPRATNTRLYTDANPLQEAEFAARAAILSEIDLYARGRDPRVVQVSASLAAEWQAVQILRADGHRVADLRPLVRLNVSIVVEANGKRESGSYGVGGRFAYSRVLNETSWKHAVDEAFRQALVNVESRPAPAGEMEVVLGNGWPGILLHEAVGHGLEGDFNRKGTSAFAGLIGKQVASKGVTVVDDGTIASRRGSLSIDDEGTPTNRTVLIEDGILVGYMQDRQNARLMNMKPTGNGRRQSHAHVPMPRMTNTYMLAGRHDPAEILASVKNGIFAANFGGGQVDITSGKYVFQCTEAYKIENGRIGAPLKGAMLIGNGPTDLHRITMIGNDLQLDSGIGTCGKNGQGVPGGVGQPTLRMERITVGGTG